MREKNRCGQPDTATANDKNGNISIRHREPLRLDTRPLN